MATSPVFSSPFLLAGASILNAPTRHNLTLLHHRKRVNFSIKAAKLPAGLRFSISSPILKFPKEQPKF
ncbi:hypothetical protein ACS0TY_026425 [Phlomoides rotata]